jgi:hypothetical protein
MKPTVILKTLIISMYLLIGCGFETYSQSFGIPLHQQNSQQRLLHHVIDSVANQAQKLDREGMAYTQDHYINDCKFINSFARKLDVPVPYTKLDVLRMIMVSYSIHGTSPIRKDFLTKGNVPLKKLLLFLSAIVFSVFVFFIPNIIQLFGRTVVWAAKRLSSITIKIPYINVRFIEEPYRCVGKCWYYFFRIPDDVVFSIDHVPWKFV